jgi:hypothetical protein
MHKRITAIGLAAALAACGSKGDKKEEPKQEKQEKTEPEVTEKKVEEPPAKKVGLLADGNDPALVAELQKVIADCGATADKQWSETSGFSWECPGYKAHVEKQVEDWKPLTATILNVLEDPDPRARYLGWKALSRAAWSINLREDKAIAEKVVARAAAETAPQIDGEVGVLISSGIDLEKTGLMPQVEAIVADPKAAPDLRRGIIAYVLGGHPKNEAAYKIVTTALAAETDPKKVEELLGSLSAAQIHTDEVCATWKKHFEGSDETLKHEAAARLTRGHTGWWFADTESSWSSSTSPFIETPNPCAAEIDTVFAYVEQKLADNALTDYDLLDAAKGPGYDDTASPEHKARSIAIAKRIVETPNHSMRYGALDFVISKAPDGKDYARQFENDADQSVKDLAVRANQS